MYIGIKKNEIIYLIEITEIKEYINYRDITKDKILLLPTNEVEKLKELNEKVVILGKE